MSRLTTWRRWGFSAMGLALLVALVLGIPWAGPGRAGDGVYEGFGAATTGGPSDTVVRVTTLANAGDGSLREALSGGNRTIVFDVGGDIVLTEYPGPAGQTLSGPLTVTGGNITIDGFTAPSPGITIVGRALVLLGDKGAHNIIVRGLRFRDARRPAGGDSDNIQVGRAASNIVFSHISTRGATDGNLDIAGDPTIPGSGPRNVTVAWSIIGEPASHKAMLIKYGTCCTTLHHNLFVRSPSRNPSASIDDVGTPATETTLDMRNNVVWDWGTGYGTLIHGGAWANVVRNYFASPDSAIFDKRGALWVCAGNPNCQGGNPAEFARAFIQGNVQGDGLTRMINGQSTETEPFRAPSVTTTDACTAARAVLAGAGPRHLDAVEQADIAAITLSGCPAGKASSTTNLISFANPSVDRGTVTFRGTVAPLDPSTFTPSGTIAFVDGGVVVKIAKLAGGKAEYSTAKLKLGPHPITATYSGDARFAASESQTVVQTVLSVPGGLARASAVSVRADLEPCCGLGTSEASAEMFRKNQVKDNVLQTDNVTIAASMPIPTGGIVGGSTARAATVRMVFTRDAERYAECFLDLVTLRRNNNIPVEARYQAKVDMKLGPDGKPVITQSRGRCDVNIATPQTQPGVPAALIGDVVTVTVSTDDTETSVMEAEVRKR